MAALLATLRALHLIGFLPKDLFYFFLFFRFVFPRFTKVSVREIFASGRSFSPVCFNCLTALDVARFLGVGSFPPPLSCGRAFYVERLGLIKHHRRRGNYFLCTSFLAASISGGQ
jgi:hypothetical protein